MTDVLEYTAGDPDLRPRADRPPIPPRMRQLSKDKRGFIVPWFVPWFNDVPEFRAMDGSKFEAAIRRDLCWLCGGPLGQHKIFVLGPMCLLTKISAEPPCHLQCAEYAAKVCPFLTHPKMRRNETNMGLIEQHGGTTHPQASPRNPGVTALWDTNGYRILRDPQHTTVLQIGAPIGVAWYTRARRATRSEVITALESGKLAVHKQALIDGTSTEHIEGNYRRALMLLPPE